MPPSPHGQKSTDRGYPVPASEVDYGIDEYLVATVGVLPTVGSSFTGKALPASEVDYGIDEYLLDHGWRSSNRGFFVHGQSPRSGEH